MPANSSIASMARSYTTKKPQASPVAFAFLPRAQRDKVTPRPRKLYVADERSVIRRMEKSAACSVRWRSIRQVTLSPHHIRRITLRSSHAADNACGSSALH